MRDRRPCGTVAVKSETDIIKGALLDECAGLVAWHRAQARLAELRPELADLNDEFERLRVPAEKAREEAAQAQQNWNAAAYKGKLPDGKGTHTWYREWQEARAHAERLWEPAAAAMHRAIDIEQEISELEKIERPKLDVLTIIVEELRK